MAAWIVCALCAVVIIKPQEFVPQLVGFPLVYVLFAAAILLCAIDVVRRRVRPALAPQVPFVVAFLAWALLTTAVKRPDALEQQAILAAIVACVFGLMAVGLSSPTGIRAFSVTFLACAVAVSAVALKQGFSPYGCMLGAPEDWEGKGELEHDGRPCETVLDCRKDAPVPDGNYRCEKVGPWATSSIGGRVRYRGSLADPNELSLMTAMAIPFALAMAERRKRVPEAAKGNAPGLPHLMSDRLISRVSGMLRGIPVAALIAAMGVVVVLAESRTGLIVFLLVLGLYFVRRAGAWGIVGGCLVGPPMLLLGGRSGAEAEQSSDERVELLREALDLIRETKGIGVGAGQFADHSSIGLTAHNAYVLAGAETGIIGMFLFGFVVYLSLKVPIAIWFGKYEVGDTVRRLAPALAVGLCAAATGILFLSWAYKDILYMFFGASAALYAVARSEDPNVRVRLSLKEAFLVCLGMVGLLVALYVAARIRG